MAVKSLVTLSSSFYNFLVISSWSMETKTLINLRYTYPFYLIQLSFNFALCTVSLPWKTRFIGTTEYFMQMAVLAGMTINWTDKKMIWRIRLWAFNAVQFKHRSVYEMFIKNNLKKIVNKVTGALMFSHSAFFDECAKVNITPLCFCLVTNFGIHRNYYVLFCLPSDTPMLNSMVKRWLGVLNIAT